MYRSYRRLCAVMRVAGPSEAGQQMEIRRLLNTWGKADLVDNVEALWRDQALNDRNKVHAVYRLVSVNCEDSSKLLERILDEVVVEVEGGRFSHPQSVARLCYCWAKARPSTPLPECLSAVLCDDKQGARGRRIGRLNSGTLAGLLWAYAKTPGTAGHESVFSVASEHLATNLTSLSGTPIREVCIMLWSFAAFWKHRRPEPLPFELLLALASRILSDPSAQPREMASALWAVATLELWRGDQDRAVVPMLRQAIEAMLPGWPYGFPTREFSNVLWAVTRTESLVNSMEVRQLMESACRLILGRGGGRPWKVEELAMVATALSGYIGKVEKEDRHATEALVTVMNSVASVGSVDGNLATFAQAMLPVADRVDQAAKAKLLVTAEEALKASRLDTTALISVIDLFGEESPSAALEAAWKAAIGLVLRHIREGRPVEIRSLGSAGAREVCKQLGVLGAPSDLPGNLQAKLVGHRFASVVEYVLTPEDGDGESVSGPPTVFLPVPQNTSSVTVLTPYHHGWVRNTEPDFRALEEVARVLEAHRDTHDCGWVRLVLSRAPCVSSLAAMAQFVERYPDVDLRVWFHPPPWKLTCIK